MARKIKSVDADTFEELARQANRHRGKIDVVSLCFSVLGGKAADAITKALTKCMTEKQIDTKVKSASKIENQIKPFQSPLTNLYHSYGAPMIYPNSFPYQAPQYQAECLTRCPGDTDAPEDFIHAEWEQETNFDSLAVTLGGSVPLPASRNVTAEEVIEGSKIFDVNSLPLRDPTHFVSGQLHNFYNKCENIVQQNNLIANNVLSWIKNGIDDFFKHFKGNYRGKTYDSDIPPVQYFPNASSCKQFYEFVCNELLDRIASGSIRVWGKVGQCTPPRLVMPLTVEPSKPRLCRDLWTKNLPFHLETLKEAHRMISHGAYMITCDEKSGYDHIEIYESSQTYFGIQLGVVSLSDNEDPVVSGMKVAYVLLQVFTRLMYTFSLYKCSLIPKTCVKYLGFLIDSLQQAYLLPPDKKQTFITLRDYILGLDKVDLKNLQRFSGKCISMNLAIPGCKLFTITREVNRSISYCVKNSKMVKVCGRLRAELEYWRFLASWIGCSKWRPEHHKQIELYIDASLYKYGVSVQVQGEKLCIGDFWKSDDMRPIHLKEAEAVLMALKSFSHMLNDSRVDILTDNVAVMSVWENQGGRDELLKDIAKDIFHLVCRNNIDLHLKYIPSALNKADLSSRSITLSDASLADHI
ncbi:hypothetical protein KUTeg_019481 [Tegillarca granosa]|uniref:Reverse transcriptase RNase H-like domain-containing protein n=1 Tax=Tegillarca granosa TaxID=220873 RepID=A0ABQ9EHR9_TEGGR|nr:hypothetical protein KUTeg_019481 [Tegillarca granosa]